MTSCAALICSGIDSELFVVNSEENILKIRNLWHFLYQAEVRGFQHDGSLHLQARSQKYGKVCLEMSIYMTIFSAFHIFSI